ncbi:MAG: DNA lyase [Verrucomicrobiae bacterium]|nr:DNA lyase [Verrucomicrobiae bacterium]
MRLWTLHPRYLDPKGLVAAWREALLAQKVLAGATTGYRHHPQLARFQAQPDPLAAIATFLAGLADEAQSRGYRFDGSKISQRRFRGQIGETRGQLLYEWGHLKTKLRARAPQIAHRFRGIATPEPHPLFRIVPGDVRDWERR